ncbi:sulfur carrier protein ThiS [Nakamurella panacisegetis]|uniref:Sulfur carrier protein ThiS n=1 Tax=Nakamurella panacisegetis TaxID=1090615 RepID=A0A1H0RHG3_9ACTN|nr:sulfur carrier protein ThiS [Nakamurella panacisegetis]SDP29002.1 sulfur carrier protein ThiS [Nakamurella panacisegetis]
MQVMLNGVPADLADGLTMADVVHTISTKTSGITVAHNGEVVPRGEWPAVDLRDGDRLDVLTAVQGG